MRQPRCWSEEVQRCRGEQAEGYLRALLSSRGRHVTHTDWRSNSKSVWCRETRETRDTETPTPDLSYTGRNEKYPRNVACCGCGLAVLPECPDPGGTARLTAGALAHDIFALCALSFSVIWHTFYAQPSRQTPWAASAWVRMLRRYMESSPSPHLEIIHLR